MAKFKNLVTGNVLETTNATAIELMKNSGRYEAVVEKAEEASAEKAAKSKA